MSKSLRLRNLMLLVMVGLVVVISAGFTFFLDRLWLQTLEAETDREMLTAAIMAKQILPADYHDRITDKDSVSDAEYQEIVERFNDICKQTGMEYLWSLMILDGKIVFTSATSPGKNATQRDQADFLEIHSNPAAYTQAFETMQPQFEVIEDKWGRLHAALVPFYDSHGRKFLVGASRRMQEFDTQRQSLLSSSMLMGSGAILLGALASLWLAGALARPIAELEKSAAKIAAGNYSEEPSFSSQALVCKEVAGLANSFELMKQAIKSREKILQNSEEQYRLLTENIKDVVWVLDTETMRFRYVSPSVKKLRGYTPEEIMAQPVTHALTPEAGEFLVNLTRGRAEDVLTGRQPAGIFYTNEVEQPCKDGSLVWTEVISSFYIKPENGRVEVLGVTRDISERKQAEDALRVKSQVIETALNAIAIAGLDGQLTYVNPAFLKMWGFSAASEVIGKSVLEFWQDQQKAAEAAQAVQATGAWAGELTGRRQDGGSFTARVSTSMVTDESGCPVCRQASFVDITESRRAEEERRASTQLLQTVIDHTQYLIYAKDRQGRFILASQSLADFFGQPGHAQLLGKTSHDFLPKATADQHRANDLAVMAQQTLIRVEETVETANETLTFLSVKFPLLDAEGNVYAVCGASVDITEQKRMEKKLRESEEKYRLLVDHSSDLIWSLNAQGVFTYASPSWERMTGYQAAVIIGMSFDQLIHPDDLLTCRAYLQAMVQRAEAAPTPQYRVRHANGSWHWHEGVSTPVLGPAGEFTSIVGVSRDVTERKLADEQLQAAQAELRRLLGVSEHSRRALLSLIEDQKEAEEQIRQLNRDLEQRVRERTALLSAANQELEAFSYSVSHDLRAPLRALDGFSAILLADYYNQLDEKGRHYLTRIQEASQRMGQLINDLLNLSHVTRAGFARRQVDLSALAQTIAAELQAQAPQRQVTFNIAANMSVEGDANLIKIALENLLQNAFKFTSKCQQANIQVGVLEQAGEHVYFVRDNGAGFNMEYAARLFAPFQRLHGTQEFPGTGIGLSIVQRIISRHGGRIWPEAEKDKGATFYFTLGGEK